MNTLQQILEKTHIVIPIIQRDYAQGRETDQAQIIRKEFLSAIKSHLEDRKALSLDFVYGTVEEGTDFVPLDGQQRLTTLFLLHWYLARKEGKYDDFLAFAKSEKGQSKFRYLTRSSSTEFCDALVANGSEFGTSYTEETINDAIQNQPWFFLSWKKDPSVKAMLTMLGHIEVIFRDTSHLFNLLVGPNPIITFQYLDLETFKLTDDLYVRMNARGKALNEFEVLKPKIEQWMNTDDAEDLNVKMKGYLPVEKKTPKEYFAENIDNKWLDFFWELTGQDTRTIYQGILNFIETVLLNEKSATAIIEAPVSRRLGNITGDPFTFQEYLDEKLISPSSIATLIKYFDKITERHQLGRICKVLFFDEESLLKLVVLGHDSSKLNYTDRVQFYAYCRYICNHYQNEENLGAWMRVIHNLSVNTSIEGVEQLHRALKSIDSMLSFSNNILAAFADNTKKVVVSFFSPLQVAEEKVKAHLIVNNAAWVEPILEAEKHVYFRGQIGFLLAFAGIDTNEETGDYFVWPDYSASILLSSFITYLHKASKVFVADGLIQLKDFVWERALLSKGNYLPKSGDNSSFLHKNYGELTWKRLLRKQNDGKRAFVKELFDDPAFDPLKMYDSLYDIIKVALISINENNWRYFIIKDPEMIKYGEYPFVRLYDPFGNNQDYPWVLLFNKSNFNGYHAELRTYFLHQLFLREPDKIGKSFKKSKYCEGRGFEKDPFLELDGFLYDNSEYKITIDYSAEHHWRIKFHSNNVIPQGLEVVITDLFSHKVDGIWQHYMSTLGAFWDWFTKLNQRLTELKA